MTPSTLTARALVARKEVFEASFQPEPNTGCFLWTRPLNRDGYGNFRFADKPSTAHRVSWMIYRGPIPKGMHIDHICRVRSCVNPDHLRVVTPTINALENSRSTAALHLRKTHCIKGHPFSPENTIRWTNPKTGRETRTCQTCAKRRRKERYLRTGETGP